MRRYGGCVIALPLRSIAQSQDKLEEKEGEIEIFENGVEDGCCVRSEWPVVLRCGEVHDDAGRQPE